MCVGVPMEVVAADAGFAWCIGRGARRRVATILIGAVEPGEFVLVFKDTAVERIDAARATEVNAALDLVEAALAGSPAAHDEPPFALPSTMTVAQIAELAGTAGASTADRHVRQHPAPFSSETT